MILGKRIAQLRREKGLSQIELAKKVGVSQRYVSTWETGKNMPHVETLLKLAQVFGVSVDHLLLENVPREGTHKIDDIELYEQFKQAEALPQEQKDAVKQLVGALLFQYKVKKTQEEIDKQRTKATKQEQLLPLRKVAGKR
jgi:transcriptional regulator with XRE-family HTH domain